MPVTLTDLREIHGSVFVTETPDGMIVPWKPLSIGDFLEYDAQFRQGQIDPSILENEIFKKCVSDQILVKNIHLQKAGTVSCVVKSIMTNSGPHSIEELNYTLDIYRNVAAQPMHQLVSVICRAFPGYTPDDVYAMDFQKMTLRLAQAENKLMALGLMTDPIALFAAGEEPKEEKRPSIKVDPKELKKAFDLQETQPMHKRVKKAKEEGQKKLDLSTEKETDELDMGSTVHGEQFIVDSNLMMMGMEIGDDNDARQLQRDAKSIYGDYFKQMKGMKKGDKIKIKTVEERVQEANARMEANRIKNIEAAKKRKKK